MNDVAENELERFLAAHPSTRFFDAFVNDLNTVERGKRIDRDGMARVFSRGMPLPGSMFAASPLYVNGCPGSSESH